MKGAFMRLSSKKDFKEFDFDFDFSNIILMN
jgi:hypothetical protein